MRNSILIFVAFIIFTPIIQAQNAKTKALVKEIEGQWEVDDNGQVTYIRIVEADSLSKDEIYTRALSYFTYNYVSGDNVTQVQDKEVGRIVGKGLYGDYDFVPGFMITDVDTWHVLRVDVKEGRARIILSLTSYLVKVSAGQYGSSTGERKISGSYPVNPDGSQKNTFGKAFYFSHKNALETLNKLEKAIKEGNTSKSIESDNW